jgi:lactoylglutathione lyase
MSLTLDDLKKRGLDPLGQPSVGKDGNTQAWLRDPDGNLIELMQVAPTSDQGNHVARSKRARK